METAMDLIKINLGFPLFWTDKIPGFSAYFQYFLLLIFYKVNGQALKT